MSDDEQESGCDTVDGSPASDSSGRSDSPFMEQRYINESNQNRPGREARVSPQVEASKPGVRTMVVPPMRVQNGNGMAEEQMANTGKEP